MGVRAFFCDWNGYVRIAPGVWICSERLEATGQIECYDLIVVDKEFYEEDLKTKRELAPTGINI